MGGTLAPLVMMGCGAGLAFSILSGLAVQGVRQGDMGVAVLNGVYATVAGHAAGMNVPALRTARLIGTLSFVAATLAAVRTSGHRRAAGTSSRLAIDA